MTYRFNTLLPNELWIFIASYLPLYSLPDLAVTCSHLLALVRLLIYRHVELKNGHRHYASALKTLELLAQDKTLAACVTELSLVSIYGELSGYQLEDTTEHWHSLINVEAFNSLVSLKHIKIDKRIFLDAEEQHSFEGALARLHTIKEVTYFSSDDSGMPWAPVDFRSIQDLKALSWQDHCGFYFVDIMSDTISHFHTTIEILKLTPFPNFNAPTNYDRLFSMYFPCLHSLELHFWDYKTTMDFDLTQFIIAHNKTLEKLGLSYCGAEGGPDLSFDTSPLALRHKDTLPRLHTFNGSTKGFTNMAKAHMRCISMTLQRLHVEQSIVDSPVQELRRMFEAILSLPTDNGNHGHLSALTDLTLDISAWKRQDDIKNAIRECALICPSLKVWGGELPDIWFNTDELVELFGLFERLEDLYLDVKNVHHLEDDDDDDDDDLIKTYVQALASHCRSLHRLHLTDHWSGSELDKINIYTVFRDKDKNVVCITMYEDD